VRSESAIVVALCGVLAAFGAPQAEALRQKALACARQKNWVCAAENYRSANRLEPDADGHYNLALALKYGGRFDEAIIEFEAALSMRPAWAEAEYGLGATLHTLHRDRPAKAALSRAIEHDPKLINARLFLADVLMADREWKEAEAQLIASPADNRVRRTLARVYLETGNPESAVAELRQCLSEKHPDATLWLELGEAYGRSGEIAKAVDSFEHSIRLDPRLSAAHLQLGVALRRDGKPAQALAQMRAAAMLAPRNPAAAFELGKSLKAAKDLPGAIASFQRALELKPDYEQARYSLGLALEAQGKAGAARKELGEVAGLHQFRERLAESKLLITAGVTLLRNGELDAAQSKFEQATEVSPTLATGFYFLAAVHDRKGEAGQALELYRQALELAPDYAQAHVGLGSWYTRRGDLPNAAKEFEDAVSIDPDLADAHYDLGLASLQLGDEAKALREFSETLSIDPAFADARIQLGLTQCHLGDTAAAVRTFRELVRREPHSAEAYNNLGLAQLQAGDSTGAAESARKAIELNPGYAEAHYNLGLALQATGQPEAAALAIQEAFRLNPNLKIPAQIEK
jgi:tetratricopeptide (TPR) repeat protein